MFNCYVELIIVLENTINHQIFEHIF